MLRCTGVLHGAWYVGQLIEHMKVAALGSPMNEGRGPLLCNLQEVWLLETLGGCDEQFNVPVIATTQVI
jgi:hypothetical protein